MCVEHLFFANLVTCIEGTPEKQHIYTKAVKTNKSADGAIKVWEYEIIAVAIVRCKY